MADDARSNFFSLMCRVFRPSGNFIVIALGGSGIHAAPAKLEQWYNQPPGR
ncbi:hypothetical protein [Nocardia sp. NPDC005745]|uniref:hypothetical protein n=1 Tax=Nocardia sp. NPDC005745 TaxID=3157061 RepID=UPI00340C06F2